MKQIDYNEIDWNQYFLYDEESPSSLRWAIDKKCVKLFDPAGSKVFYGKGEEKPKCWDVRLNGRLYKVHRIVWILNHGEINNDLVINHKDCNPFNNKIDNLECVMQADNMRRCKSHTIGLQNNNTSGHTGVGVLNRGGEIYCYQSAIRNSSGIIETYTFSVKRYGNDLAKLLAKTSRDFQIKQLEKENIYYG